MHHNLAALYTDRGEIERAMPHHLASVEIDPTYAQAWEGLARADEHNGEIQKAEREYERALEVDPKSPKCRIAYAKFLQSQARFDEASRQLIAAAALDSQDPQIKRELRELEREQRIVKANPASLQPKERAQAQLARGIELERQSQFEEAGKAYRAAIDLDPTNFDAWNNLGLSLVKQRRTAQAEPCFAKAVEIRADDSVGRLNWGNSLIELGRVREGAVQLQEALRLDPNSIQARSGLQYAATLLDAKSKK
jgi:Tfp pilus assembly protein PilF